MSEAPTDRPDFDIANAPVIVNQMGPFVHATLKSHWSRPIIVDHPADTPPWDVLQSADILMTRPFAGWNKAPTLRPPSWPSKISWIQIASTGVDYFPDWFLDGPPVTTGRGTQAIPIAEYVLAAIFAFEKRFYDARARSRNDWGNDSFHQALRPVFGKTLGIVGYGAIGSAIAARARAFGMNVNVLRRSKNAADIDIAVVHSIHDLVRSADHLVLAAPLTPQTTRMINADVLSVAKRSMHLINVARGPIVDQIALLQALDQGWLSGATLDVTDPEPPDDTDPIYSHPKVMVTPHISWLSEGNSERLAKKIAANLDLYMTKKPLIDVFNKSLGY